MKKSRGRAVVVGEISRGARPYGNDENVQKNTRFFTKNQQLLLKQMRGRFCGSSGLVLSEFTLGPVSWVHADVHAVRLAQRFVQRQAVATCGRSLHEYAEKNQLRTHHPRDEMEARAAPSF